MLQRDVQRLKLASMAKNMKTFALLFLFLIVAAGKTPVRAEPGRSIVMMTETHGPFGGGRAYLPVSFGGFLGLMRLDTGASTSRIALAPWNRDLPSIGKSQSLAASGQVSLCDDVEARNVEVKASEGNNIGRAKYIVTRCPTGDELLGLDFFRGTRLTLDFRLKEMIFFDTVPAQGDRQTVELLGPDHRLLGVPLNAGETPIFGLFDTGAELSAVDRPFVQAHKNLFTFVKHRQQADGAGGGAFSPDIYRIKKVDFGGGRIFRDIYVLVYDFGGIRQALGARTPMILGYNLLRKLRWNFDFTVAGTPTWSAQPQ
jgi:hypothetical protein